MASMAAYVGLAYEDINWEMHSPAESVQLLSEGKIDAFLLSPPELQELRTKHRSHAIVNGTLDRPWSQYFCCIVAGIASSCASTRWPPSGQYGRS
jgi:NitT/TauT family transport system substrate-binding protein